MSHTETKCCAVMVLKYAGTEQLFAEPQTALGGAAVIRYYSRSSFGLPCLLLILLESPGTSSIEHEGKNGFQTTKLL